MPGEPSPKYRAYLLRCWQEESMPAGGKPLWRFSVERILPVTKAGGGGRGGGLGGLRGAAGGSVERRSGQTLPASGDYPRRGFRSLEDLVAFLEAQLDGEDGATDNER